LGTIVAPAERKELGLASDHELVAAVRRGDDRAFERLYERYHRRIAAYVYGMVSDYGRAEDITQEVFISALRRMRETERPIAFKPWVYEIAKNACIDQFRRSRRAEEISYDADEGVGALEHSRLAAVDGGPDDAIDTKQQLDHLCGAFGGLSETHHQILVLRELEGMSYREIGEKMGLSRPSVESTLFRARRRLTEEYDELVSGQRCTRIQTIILDAAQSSLGARDQRRLVRHIAHCQPCRREARLAGLETGMLSRNPVRDVAAKVAAFFPFPFVFRSRRGGGSMNHDAAAPGFVAQMSGPLSNMADPIAGWTKAAAAAATLLVAGAGAGAVSQLSSGAEKGAQPLRSGAVAQPASAKPISVEKSSGVAAGGMTVRPAAQTKRTAAKEKASSPQRSTTPITRSGGGAKMQGAANEPSNSRNVTSGPPAAPSVPRTSSGGEDNPLPSTGAPQVTVPASPQAAAQEAADTLQTVDPRAGGVADQAVGLLGP
jgi:RNA polymerase sigma factor (sigma-70 family)